MLNQRQQAILDSFLQKLKGNMTPDQFQQVEGVIKSQMDLEVLASRLDTLNHTAPEARHEPTKQVYYGLGIRNILADAGLDEDQRGKIINEVAGTEVAHRRTRPEG